MVIFNQRVAKCSLEFVTQDLRLVLSGSAAGQGSHFCVIVTEYGERYHLMRCPSARQTNRENQVQCITSDEEVP